MASVAFLEKAYLAYFGRPADQSGLDTYAYATEEQVEAAFSASPESQSLYGATFGYAQINAIYLMLFNRPAEPAGLTYWTNQVASGAFSPAAAAMSILLGAQNDDATAVANKLATSAAFTAALNTTEEILAYSGDVAAGTARAFLSTVTTAPASAAAIDAAILSITDLDAPTSTIMLSTAHDNLVGTTAADSFVANVVQNVNGEQTNQLATGDQLAGGAGVDSLFATVQMASALNNSASQAITPITVSVEEAWFRALTVDNDSEALLPINAQETVIINAKSMLGLTQVASDDSDASLLIQNLTTLTNSGLYEDKRDTETVTIRMDHSGNDAAVDAESNLTVLFDNDYLLSDQTTQSETFWWILDQNANIANDVPLLNIDSDGVTFTIDGVANYVAIPAAAFVALDGTWEDFRDALNAQVAATPALAGYTFSLDYTNYKVITLANGVQSYNIPALVLTAPEGIDVTSVGFHHYDDATGAYDVYGSLADQPIVTTILPVIATIELEKVGRGAEGGDLTVGGMATDYANEWNYSESAIKEGVEQFNITISGDASQFSSLASLQSTNNTLEIVNLTSAEGSLADLFIGNHNTLTNAQLNLQVATAANDTVNTNIYDLTTAMNAALKDVRVFDATLVDNDGADADSEVDTDVDVYAYLSDEVVDKYMDLTDSVDPVTGLPVAPAADNANFVYSFAGGDDLLNINLSKANLAVAGTTNREDFSFAANMGAGDDTVETQIGDGTGVATDGWYVNSNINANLTINTDAGNDTVRTFGAGSWNVNLGADNDVIYSDNSGFQTVANVEVVDNNAGRAVWVLNTADQVTLVGAVIPVGQNGAAERDIDNLVSDTNTNEDGAFYKATVTVNLRGITATAIVDDYNTTDLELNNVIKGIIQGNEFLRDLIVAEDGPGNTLVIRSLTDGVFSAADLTFGIAANALTTISSADLAAFNAANGLVGAAALTDVAGVNTFITNDINAWVADTDYDTAMANNGGNAAGTDELVGAVSTAATASVIVDGTGNDTIVLSTTDDVNPDHEMVHLVADGQADVIYNATHATITGLEATDTVVLSNGASYTGLIGTLSVDVVAGVSTLTGGDATNDTIHGTAGVDTILGLGGNDTLSGLAGADNINGGAGNDVITGGADADAIALGAGTDTLVFNSLTGADTIADYAIVDDSIQVSKTAFAALGPVGALSAAEFEVGAAATAATTRFIYNAGALSYDADGDGAGAAVLIGTFTGAPLIVAAEITIIA